MPEQTALRSGEYVWLDLDDGAQMVMVEEDHGPVYPGAVSRLFTVRYLNSEACTTVRSTALSREHPKAVQGQMVRRAAGLR
jgi:hypothetical protein